MTLLSIAQRAVIGSAIEEACATLPPGWNIKIDLEFEGGSVDLYDPAGNKIDYPSNHEKLSDSIRDAIECAIELAAAVERGR